MNDYVCFNVKNMKKAQIYEIENLEGVLKKFIDSPQNKRNGRYQSWNLCYDYFQKLFQNNQSKDEEYAALMLGFFLASWGMYRGSSFLLKDYTYTVHKETVNTLLKHSPLLTKKLLTEDEIERLWNLCEELKGIYGKLKDESSQAESDNNRKVSQILITKIIMGVSGLLPAYDRYVVKALKERGLYQTFNKTSCEQLLELYKRNQEDITKLQKDKKYKTYPPMKILDIYLWEEGRKLEENKKKEKQK